MEDLQQLHYQVKQLCEQYNIQSENESVTIYYEEDSREVFSSFDRFKISGSTSISPIESILVKYNFLVILPKSRRPQSYSLSIRLGSRVTIIRKMRKEISARLIHMMQMQVPNATVTVKYVDYVVARNLLDGVDRWINGLPTYEYPKWFTFVRRHSEYVQHTIRYVLGAFGVYLVLSLVPEFVPKSAPDFQVLFYFAIVGSISIFGLFRLGQYLGSQVEGALDDLQAISYVQLNRGDQKSIKQAQLQIWKNLARGVFGTGGSVAIGVISSYFAKWLGA